MSKPTLDDVFVIHDDEPAGYDCAACGDEFEPGEKAVRVPMDYNRPKWKVTIHLHCAVKGDEIELTSVSPDSNSQEAYSNEAKQ